MNDAIQTAYGPDDLVFPTPSDADLWLSVLTFLQHEYPDRALEAHVREAFESVCRELDDSLPFKNFLRKVRIAWMWRRPATPRGVEGFE